MYTSRCDASSIAAIPRARWATFAWSDSGMQSADPTIGPTWADAATVVPMLWEHFERANEQFGLAIALLEIGSFKRYGPGAACPDHVDHPQPLTDGRLLSMSIQVDASPDLAGGELSVNVDGVEHRTTLDTGALTVFPSAAPHSVSTVTRGTRTVLVARALATDGYVASTWLWRPDGTPARRCPRPTGSQLRHYQRQLRASRPTSTGAG